MFESRGKKIDESANRRTHHTHHSPSISQHPQLRGQQDNPDEMAVLTGGIGLGDGTQREQVVL
jgi:hypothetical protein